MKGFFKLFTVISLLLCTAALLISCDAGHEHTPGECVIENVVEATCEDFGTYDEVVYCTECNEEISRNEMTKPSLGHSFLYGECTACFAEEKIDSSVGLSFEKNADGKGYTLTGIGECTEKDIVVGYYDSLPVTAIAQRAFMDLTEIESITLGRSVIYIGNNAFNSCKGLKKATLGDRTSYVGEGAFSYCTALESIVVDKYGDLVLTSLDNVGNTEEDSLFTSAPDIDEYDWEIGNLGFFGCMALRALVIPYGIQVIGEEAFSGLPKLGCVVIPSSVRYIGKSAFESSSIKKLIIEEGTEYILDRAFACTSVQSVQLPNSVKYIGEEVFADCWEMEEFFISASVEYIGKNVFYQNVLTGIDVDEANGFYKSVDGVLFTKDGKTLVAFPRAAADSTYSYTVPEGTEVIADYALWYTELASLTLPSTLCTIGDKALFGIITGEISIAAGNSFYKIVDGSIYSEDGRALVMFRGSSGELTEIADGVEIIESYAFNGCYVGNLVLPDSLTVLSEYAFYCAAIDTLIIGEGLQEIKPYSFYGTSVGHVEIGGNVHTIGDNAFYGGYLNELILTEGLKHIGDYAFGEVFFEAPLVIPASVETVGRLYHDQYRALSIENNEKVFKVVDDYFLCSADGRVLYATLYDYETEYSEDEPNEIVIPECVEEIGNDSIRYPYSGIHFVTMHEGIKSIGNLSVKLSLDGVLYVPAGVSYINLDKGLPYKEIVVDPANEVYSSFDGVLYSADGTTLLKYPNYKPGKSFTVPEGVVTIASNAVRPFGLEEIIFSSTVRNLGKSCIQGGGSLKRIVLNEGLEVISEGAFTQIYATNEVEFVISSSVRRIERSAFVFCQISKIVYLGSRLEWLMIEVPGIGNNKITSARWEFAS